MVGMPTSRGRFAWPLISIGLGFLLLFLAAAALIVFSRLQVDASNAIRDARDSVSRLAALQLLLSDAETGQRGYLLTGKSDYLEPYESARRLVPLATERLSPSVENDAEAKKDLKQLESLVQSKFAEMQRTIDLRAANDMNGAIAIVNSDSGKDWMDKLRATIGALHEKLDSVLAARREKSERLADARENLLSFTALAILLVGFFSVFETRRQLHELARTRRRIQEEERSRIQAETQVHQLQKMDAVGQLTGGIAHDFNNMLGVVTASLDSAKLKLSENSHPALRFIDMALAATQRAAALTARLLAFSRQQPLSPEVLDVNKLITGISDLLRRSLGETVESEFVLGGGIWKVYADPVQVETCLLNLSVNARDAMPEGGKLTIETHNSSLDDLYANEHVDVKPGQYVLLSVSDTGTGMSAETIHRAFEPFYTTKSPDRGTGLGLSQVFGFVKQSGGHVKIYSELRQGSTIKIYLPRYVGTAEAATPRVVTADELPQGSASTVILLVEDEDSLREVTRDLLDSLGYTVIDTAFPSAALEIVRERADISLLFTDIVMPGMNGRQLADEAKKIRSELPVLFTTGYTRNAIVHNGMVDAGVALLQKPFTIAQLADKVKRVLAQA